jgi:hypothetical protein
MLDLSLGFKTLPNLLLFLLLVLVSFALIYQRLKKESNFSLLPFILINALFFLVWGWLTGICHDTSEHLHCAWMVSQGLIPYKDFWQHHPPLLWLILAPIFKILRPTVLIFDAARIFSLFLFTLIAFIGWKISRTVWGKKARLPVYLLMLFSVSTYGQFLLFRPDLFMDIFLLVGIYFSLKIPEKRLSPVFLSGVSFALAGSFALKQYLLYLLPVIVILLEKNKARTVRLLLYLAGLAVGSAPTLFFLIKKDILSDFIYWVLIFNRERLVLSVYFPVAILLAGAWGAYQLLIRYRNSKDIKALILFIAFCLSCFSSLSRHTFFYPFYIGFWFILCVIVSSGCNIIEILGRIPSLIKKSIIASLFLVLLIFPNYLIMMHHEETYFSEHKQVISKLMEYCQGDTALVLLPLHPIFCYDSTRLYSFWQFLTSNHISSLRDDIKSKDIAEAIINSPPAVIEYKFSTYKYDGQIFILDLLLKKLVTSEDFKRIRSFLDENYTVKPIGNFKYYIRNDKLRNRQ